MSSEGSLVVVPSWPGTRMGTFPTGTAEVAAPSEYTGIQRFSVTEAEPPR